MSIQAILLGNTQDGGLPQPGCSCPNCIQAHHATQRQFVCCLGLVDTDRRAAWIFDATPHFPEQLHLLQTRYRGCSLEGIFLTHAHIGHYTGLMYLGREAMNTHRLPVYATESMQSFLRTHAPWKQTVELENIELLTLPYGMSFFLAPGVNLTAVLVPHRGEFSDTVAFLIDGPHKRLFYCPDVDRLSHCAFDIRALMSQVDIALIDGTFYSADELKGRSMEEIPHPLVTESASYFQGLEKIVHFIHLNHSNPLWRTGPEQANLAQQGFELVSQGQTWTL